MSARLREFSPPVWTPRDFAGARRTPRRDLRPALILGNERFGLPNQIVEQCNVLINIPANPGVFLAEPVAGGPGAGLRMPDGRASRARHASRGRSASRARRPALAQIDGMYAHLEEALVAIGFLDADNPKKLMPRLKRLFARTQLETEEVNILRGIANHILKHK